MAYTKRWVKIDSLNGKRKVSVKRLEISPILRYSFERDKSTGYLRLNYSAKNSRLIIKGGRYIQQYNWEDPIHPFVNTFTTLLLGNNLMKIYERDFVDLSYRQRFNDKYTFIGNVNWAKRYELFNHSNYTVFNSNKGEYTPNAPINVELPSTTFQPNTALVSTIGFTAQPWIK